MKKLIVCITAAVMASLLCACVPTDRTEIAIDPVLTDDMDSKVAFEFEQLHNDTMDAFADTNPYAYITDVSITGSNSSRNITIDAKCLEGVEKEEADQFLSACVRHISESAASQYQRFEGASETTFGPLWDMYSLTATVTPDVEGAEPVESISVKAGEQIPLDPNIEKYEEEWEKALEIYLRNVG